MSNTKETYWYFMLLFYMMGVFSLAVGLVALQNNMQKIVVGSTIALVTFGVLATYNLKVFNYKQRVENSENDT